MLRDLVNKTVPIETVVEDFYKPVPRSGFVSCPFHAEGKPSLKVYGGSGGWYCFSCGRGGGAVEFYRDYKGVGTSKAVRVLAARYNVVVQLGAEIKLSKPTPPDEVCRAFINGWEKETMSKFWRNLDRCRPKLKSQVLEAWQMHGLDLIERIVHDFILTGDDKEVSLFGDMFKRYTRSMIECQEEHDTAKMVAKVGYHEGTKTGVRSRGKRDRKGREEDY